MKRRDAVRSALAGVVSFSVVPLSGQLAPETGSTSSVADAPTDESSDADSVDPAVDSVDPAVDSVDPAVDTVDSDSSVADGSAVIDGNPGGEFDDDALEEFTEELRQTHAERCQCPACGGSMPGRG